MLELKDIKKMVDKDYLHNQTTRERAANDMVFYWISHWDDEFLSASDLAYKGEFDILRKAGRQIMADLRANPVQVDFEPEDDSREDAGDLADGLYRSSDRLNLSQEAYLNAQGEAVVCGVGGWELYTEYETNRVGDERQVIKRRPIYEANNNSFPDSNAKRLDKSDAKRWTLIEAYSVDGYKDLVKELTGEEVDDVDVSNFKTPEQSYSFPWITGKNEIIYVGKFFHKILVKDKVLTLVDPFGQPLLLRESDLEDIMDELIDAGYTIDEERTKEIKRWEVTLYICSGERILEHYRIPGENIPIVHNYGERAFIEGEEHYEGVTRLAKDPQRLRDFILSYIGDIASRSPRLKPIFGAEQVKGFEFMYEESGADNNYPYYLQNLIDDQGNELPQGPAGLMPEQTIPQAVSALADLSRQAVEDVANPGLPQDIADPDISGKAVLAIQARLDQQSIVYQQNMKHAKRRDGEIWASMASEVYDSPREVTLTLPDGTRKKAQIMETILDRQTGEVKVLNDLTNMAFQVFADIGRDYATRKEQTIDQLDAMAATTTDPNMQMMLNLKRMTLIDGVDMDDIRDYAKRQLLLRGFREPETEEEMMLVQQAQQNQQPDPNLLIGQAEMLKGQAAVMKEQRQGMVDQAKIQNDQAQTQVDVFNAETDRLNVQVAAERAGAEIDYKRIQGFSTQMDTAMKAAEFRARVSPAPQMVQ